MDYKVKSLYKFCSTLMVTFMFRFCLFALFFFMPLVVYADCCGGGGGGGGGALGECPIGGYVVRDYNPLMLFVNSKRSECGEEKWENLTISGDVRTSWAHIGEKFRGCQLRGSNSVGYIEPDCAGSSVVFHKPLDAFEITLNLYVDYVYDRAWGVIWLGFNNLAGLQGSFPCCNVDPAACRGSGTCEAICLRKAYIGYNLITDGCFRLDIEIGRRPLWTVFDSYVQFKNRFDGILLFGSYNVCGEMDVYVKGGPFLIDQRVHHYGYVAEAGLLNIYDSRFDVKYSIIDWQKRGKNRCLVKNSLGSDYLNSQITVAYWLNTDYLWQKTKLYGAWLINHEGRKHHELAIPLADEDDLDADPKKWVIPRGHNTAWYAGFLIGQICGKGDWSLDVNYQWVEARAIPDSDLSGIGNGGLATCFCFDDAILDGLCPGPFFLNRGNYKGWHIEAIYAFTDNLICDVRLNFSSAIDTRIIRGKHNYSQFLVQAIYAF